MCSCEVGGSTVVSREGFCRSHGVCLCSALHSVQPVELQEGIGVRDPS